MVRNDMSDILEKLSHLSKTDLKEIQSRTTFLLGKDRGEADSDEKLVYHQMCSVFKEHDGRTLPPFAILKKGKHYKSFQKGAEEVLRVVKHDLKPKTKADTVHGIAVLLRMMKVHTLRNKEDVLDEYYFVWAMGHAVVVLDTQFPGYRESGLLPLILNAELRQGG